MTHPRFSQLLADDPHLASPIRRAAQAGRPARYSVLTEAAVVALMFPIVKHVLTTIGLPWLHELRRYSELQRRKLHEWIDTECRKERIDPDAAEAASNALCEELERITDASARASWESLRDVLIKSSVNSEA